MYMRKFRYLSWNDKIFYIITNTIMTLFFLAVLYPCIYVISASFSPGNMVVNGKVLLFPVNFTFENYKLTLGQKQIWIGLYNSLLYAVVDVAISTTMTMTTAYCLSRDDVPGSKYIMLGFTVTMFFSGGLIPNYLLLRSLNMLNTLWSLVVPGCVSAYNMIVARTFIRSTIPKELLEASIMDGCSDFRYYIRIVIPLSKAIIAVNALLYFVGQWNSYMKPMMYLNERSKFTLPIFLKEILIASKVEATDMMDIEGYAALNERVAAMKYSVILITMVPILCLYPFIQKYFVKGVMVGSVKG